MKYLHRFTLLAVIAMAILAAMSGCASFTTTQTDERKNEQTGEITTVTTKAKSRTFFDSKSQLANFKATQTDKTQTASVGSLSQEASSTNLNSLAESIAYGAAKGAVGK